MFYQQNSCKLFYIYINNLKLFNIKLFVARNYQQNHINKMSQNVQIKTPEHLTKLIM